MPDGERQPDAVALAEENARLKAELDAAKRAAAEATNWGDSASVRAAAAARGSQAAQVAQLEAQEQAAKNTILSIDGEIKGLKARWASLQAEGKFEEAADLQEAIGDATARRLQAKQAQDYFGSQKTQVGAAPADPVEQYIAANRGEFSDEDAAWIRRNRRFVEDRAFNERVRAAHAEALGQGIAHRSADYYRFLERRGYMQPEPLAAKPAGAPAEGRPSSDVAPQGAAPTGYDGGSPESGGDAGIELQIIQPEDRQVATQTGGAAFERRPAEPQARAAGPGSLQAAIAAAPSRRQAGQDGRRVVARLTQSELDTAIAAAPHMAPKEVLDGGPPAIAVWWQGLRESPAAQRIKQGWG